MITDYVLGPGCLLWVGDVAVDNENKTPCHQALKERTHRDIQRSAWHMEFILQSELELATEDRHAVVSPEHSRL